MTASMAALAVAVGSAGVLAGCASSAAAAHRVRRRAGLRTRSLPATRVAGAGGIVGAVVLAGPVAGALALAVAALAPPALRRRRAHAARVAATDALADTVDLLARTLRSGAAPASALASTADVAAPLLAVGLRAAATSVERGVPVAAAVEGWATAARREGLDGTDVVAAAWAVTAAAGGDPARALAAAADTLRDRRAARREVRALAAQARLSALVIAVAPVGFAVVAAAVDDATAAVLLRSPLGGACLAGGLALDAAGWWWMGRITRSVA